MIVVHHLPIDHLKYRLFLLRRLDSGCEFVRTGLLRTPELRLRQMADVFISYGRADRQGAVALAQLLSRIGYSVWWDRDLIAGHDFDLVITRELSAARCVVVIWSPSSIGSSYVRDEARRANRDGKLIPIAMGFVEPPLGFGSLHTLSISFPPTSNADFIRDLERAVQRYVHLQTPASRLGSGEQIIVAQSFVGSESMDIAPMLKRSKAEEWLPQLLEVTNPFQLFEIVAQQEYTFLTTSSMREYIRLSDRPSQILDTAADVIAGTWRSHPAVAGILSSVLSTTVDLWHPPENVVLKFDQLCKEAIGSGEVGVVGSVEPLAFTLSAKGHRDSHRALLARFIEDANWRDIDSARVRGYYGAAEIELAAIIRHRRDPFRQALLRVNDVGRLIQLALSMAQRRPNAGMRRVVTRLLDEHANELKSCGEIALAGRVKGVESLLFSPPQNRS